MSQAAGSDLVIRRARIDGSPSLADIAIAGGRIVDVAARIEHDSDHELDAEGRLVAPAFVEPHMHLDKTGVWPRLPATKTGTLEEAVQIMAEVKRSARVEEIRERAGVLIRQAVLAGTTVFRTHVDVDSVSELKGLQGVSLARDDHADLCDIQIVAFPQRGIEREPDARDLMREAMRSGADVVGGMPHWELDQEASSRHIDFCLELAVRHDADVDMHVDESDDPDCRTLDLLVEATERYGWGGRVSAGHCCSMAAWDDEYAAAVIERAARAGVNIITNPSTNLMIQGREDSEPRRRGIPRIKELLAAGVPLACGQDNVYDGFYPFGTGDRLQVALILAHAAQLATAEEIAAALDMVSGGAARVLRLPDYGIFEGARADLVILDAESQVEALRLQANRRWVLRGGRVVAQTRVEQRLERDPAS